MSGRYRFHSVPVVRVFDLVDGFAADRGSAGARPRPIGAVRIFLLTGPAAAAGPAQMLLTGNRDGFLTFFGSVRTAAGRRRLVLAGDHTLRVVSDCYQQLDVRGVDLPGAAVVPQPFPIRLSPGPLYPFPIVTVPAATRTGPVLLSGPVPSGPTVLRGTLKDADGRPVAGARVDGPGADQAAVTTAIGDWLLLFPPGVAAPAETSLTFTRPDATDPAH